MESEWDMVESQVHQEAEIVLLLFQETVAVKELEGVAQVPQMPPFISQDFSVLCPNIRTYPVTRSIFGLYLYDVLLGSFLLHCKFSIFYLVSCAGALVQVVNIQPRAAYPYQETLRCTFMYQPLQIQIFQLGNYVKKVKRLLIMNLFIRER